MKLASLLLFFFILEFIPSTPVFCQTSSKDSVLVAATVESIGKHYAEAMGSNSPFINGPEYTDYRLPYMKGNQFFGTGKLEPGSVYYDGALYQEVPLMYDIKLDQVVSKVPSNPLIFRLVSEKIKYFTIGSRTFTRIQTDTVTRYSVPTGFYDLLVDGNTKLLAKHVKVLHTKAGPNGVEGSFPEATDYFLKKANNFYPVGSKGAITKLLSDKKSELEAYARQHKLKFGKATKEASAVELVNYYNSLQGQVSSRN